MVNFKSLSKQIEEVNSILKDNGMLILVGFFISFIFTKLDGDILGSGEFTSNTLLNSFVIGIPSILLFFLFSLIIIQLFQKSFVRDKSWKAFINNFNFISFILSSFLALFLVGLSIDLFSKLRYEISFAVIFVVAIIGYFIMAGLVLFVPSLVYLLLIKIAELYDSELKKNLVYFFGNTFFLLVPLWTYYNYPNLLVLFSIYVGYGVIIYLLILYKLIRNIPYIVFKFFIICYKFFSKIKLFIRKKK